MSVVVLADEQPFALGDLTVRPALRQIVCADGSEHILEPRVMQVLVALARAQGGIVSREKLFEQCWEGRIVGEDAINRVIARLRQFAQAEVASAFRIETIPRVGYRLLLRDQLETQGLETAAPTPPMVPLPVPNRRALLIGGAAAMAALAAGGATVWLTRQPAAPSKPEILPEAAALLARALSAARRGTPDGVAESIGLYNKVLQMAPGHADAWGGLAAVHGYAIHGNLRYAEANRLQAKAAMERAFALDPHNAFAYAAKSSLYPRRGHWLEIEPILREGLHYHPDSDELWLELAFMLGAVGRAAEAADAINKAVANAAALDPALAWYQIQSLWIANRLQEADAASERARALLPRQSYVWFSHFALLLFTGRVSEALTFASDIDGRPPGIPDSDFELQVTIATALNTHASADIDKAAAAVLAQAHTGGGYAENAIVSLSALGRLDDAFMVANGAYFDRGFSVGTLRFSPEQRVYTPLDERRTRPLFFPPTRPMRRDPRFLALVTELKLVDYWQKSGVRPDYQAGGDG